MCVCVYVCGGVCERELVCVCYCAEAQTSAVHRVGVLGLLSQRQLAFLGDYLLRPQREDVGSGGHVSRGLVLFKCSNGFNSLAQTSISKCFEDAGFGVFLTHE